MPSVFLYEEKEDEWLMEQYMAGNDAAFSELYRRYKARAYGFLSQRISDSGLVDECFQQVFLKLHRSRAQYEKGRLFSAWFFTICRTTLIDELRKRARSPSFSSVEESERFISKQEESSSVAVSLSKEVLLDLPERQREVIRLRFEEDLDFHEIAKRLNTTSDNIRQLLSRGVKNLRKLLGSKNESK